MLDKLIDFILNTIEDINPIFFVKEYQEAVVLRGGKFLKVETKGPHLKIPFVDEVIKYHTVWTTLTLPAQSLVTLDGTNVVVKGMVKYRVTDIKTFVLEVYDSTDAISDICQATIKNIIMCKPWRECIDLEIDNIISKKSRVELKRWGIEISQVTLTDIAPIRTIRLINENVPNN